MEIPDIDEIKGICIGESDINAIVNSVIVHINQGIVTLQKLKKNIL